MIYISSGCSFSIFLTLAIACYHWQKEMESAFKSLALCAVMTLALSFVSCSKGEHEENTSRPNVILLLIDALRADRLGCYGHRRDTSPGLDLMSRKGLLFKKAFSHSSHTKLSVAALLSGLVPPSNGVRRAAEVDELFDREGRVTSDVLPRGINTLAEVLSKSGYETAALITNPHIMGRMGFSQGFETYRYLGAGATARLVNAQVLGWIESNGQRPFFLYVHYMDVHAPYRPQPPFDRRFTMGLDGARPIWKNGPYNKEPTPAQVDYTKALYDGQIAYWDSEFQELMLVLDQKALLANTLVIVTSDHGDEFYEHGGFGHGYTCYEEMVRVPLIMSWRNVIPEGTVRQDAASLVDLAPTIARLAGADACDPGFQGRDLFEHGFSGPSRIEFWRHADSYPVYAETFYGRAPRCIRTRDKKLVVNEKDGTRELYLLAGDPGENNNAAREQGDRHDRLWEELDMLMRKQPEAKARRKELDREAIKELEGLGYLNP